MYNPKSKRTSKQLGPVKKNTLDGLTANKNIDDIRALSKISNVQTQEIKNVSSGLSKVSSSVSSKQNKLKLTTTGSSGPATLSNDILNVPDYSLGMGITIGATTIASGTVGRVLFQGAGNVVQQAAGLFYDDTNGRFGVGTSTPLAVGHFQGSITASGAIARNALINGTLTAAVNNDVLVGLDIAPTFINGAFTGLTNIDLRTKSAGVVIGSGYGYGALYGYGNDGIVQVKDGGTGILGSAFSTQLIFRPAGNSGGLNSNYWGYLEQSAGGFLLTSARYQSLYLRAGTGGSTNDMFFQSSTNTVMTIKGTTSSVLIGTTVDAGFKFLVNGTARFNGSIHFANDGTGTNGLYFQRNANNNWKLDSTNGVGEIFRIAGNTFTIGQDTYINRGGLTVTPTLSGAPKAVTINHTWNNAATTFNALDINVTNTASGALSNIIDLSIGGISGFIVDKSFNVLIGTSTPSLFKLDVNGSARVQSGLTVDGSLTLNSSDISSTWTAYTPTWSTDGATQPSLGDGTITGAYKVIGKTVFVRIKLNFGTTTTSGTGTFYFSLPVNAATPASVMFPCSILDNGFAWYQATANGQYGGFTDKVALIGQSPGGANSSQGVSGLFPIGFGNLDSIQFGGSYESI